MDFLGAAGVAFVVYLVLKAWVESFLRRMS